MSENKVKIALGIISLLLLVVGVWSGGKQRWTIEGMENPNSLTEKEVSEVEQLFRDQSDDVINMYNLAILSYQKEKYDEAEEILMSLLNSNDADEKTVKAALYNLGNIAVKKSEQEENLETQLKLLMKSLLYYRSVIEKEKQVEKYSNVEVEQDEDTHHNYVVVRKKIKLLQAKLAQQKKEQERGKQLYQLLKEFRSDEELIAEELDAMKSEPFSKQSLAKREVLLKKRVDTLNKLQVIHDKIIELIKPQMKQPSASNTI